MAVFSCRSYRPVTVKRCLVRSRLRKFRGSRLTQLISRSIRSLKPGNSGRFKRALIKGNVYHFKRQKVTSKVRTLTPVSSFPIAGKLYRVPNFFSCLTYQYGSKIRKSLILVSSLNSKEINQDKDYLTLNKLDWVDFGLVPSDNNSLEEILSALILSWQAELDSERIAVVFYRYLKVEQKAQWFEAQSYLINVFSALVDNKFPSPHTFRI